MREIIDWLQLEIEAAESDPDYPMLCPMEPTTDDARAILTALKAGQALAATIGEGTRVAASEDTQVEWSGAYHDAKAALLAAYEVTP